MTIEQFHLLRAGDVILGKGGTERRILETNRDKENYPWSRDVTLYIVLNKIRQSWTNSTTTTYVTCDARNFEPLEHIDKHIWTVKSGSVRKERLEKQRENAFKMLKYYQERIAKLSTDQV